MKEEWESKRGMEQKICGEIFKRIFPGKMNLN
jgi:hypothetical protein